MASVDVCVVVVEGVGVRENGAGRTAAGVAQDAVLLRRMYLRFFTTCIQSSVVSLLHHNGWLCKEFHVHAMQVASAFYPGQVSSALQP